MRWTRRDRLAAATSQSTKNGHQRQPSSQARLGRYPHDLRDASTHSENKFTMERVRMKRVFQAAVLGASLAVAQSERPLSLPGTETAPSRLDLSLAHEVRYALKRGRDWLATRQNREGSWGTPPDVETTALAHMVFGSDPLRDRAVPVRSRSAAWLAQQNPETLTPREVALAAWALMWPPDVASSASAPVKRFRGRLRTLLPAIEEPRTLAYAMIALEAPLADRRLREGGDRVDSPAGEPGPIHATEGSNEPFLRTLGVQLLLAYMQGVPPESADVRALTAQLAGCDWGTEFLADERDYEALFMSAMGLTLYRMHRLADADGRLQAWRPRVARLLINAQRIRPDGTVHWKTARGGDSEERTTAWALLTLMLVGAE